MFWCMYVCMYACMYVCAKSSCLLKTSWRQMLVRLVTQYLIERCLIVVFWLAFLFSSILHFPGAFTDIVSLFFLQLWKDSWQKRSILPFVHGSYWTGWWRFPWVCRHRWWQERAQKPRSTWNKHIYYTYILNNVSNFEFRLSPFLWPFLTILWLASYKLWRKPKYPAVTSA